ncbi:hypothetical protein NC652_038811 [Populus alba x Populus x berolinensis]|uniref:Uncharacterized protein n=1 Tax=Populus alba x Populus x berolinensis TaxID=444605 RepID=A0AAD6LHQ0_9ROSI|nr:hypothetical protein NC652_038811 [Populus alba x Populus x berolinensis]KAJ6960848.1 hypothetical protein NC653_038759 [Populus alba x Populus x berolinensis]
MTPKMASANTVNQLQLQSRHIYFNAWLVINIVIHTYIRN